MGLDDKKELYEVFPENVVKTLSNRYFHCDEKGEHMHPNKEQNICYHCYRPLKHKPTSMDFLLKRSPLMKEADPKTIMILRNRVIKDQKHFDWFRALCKLKRELEHN